MESLNISIDDNKESTNAKAFVEALTLSIQLLDLIDRATSPQGSNEILWRIANASKNSPLTATLVGDTSGATMTGDPSTVFRSAVHGIASLRSSAVCPEGFTEDSLNTIKAFGRLRPLGVRVMRFSADKTNADITRDVIQNANLATQKLQIKRSHTFEDTGSIEGDFLTLSGKGNVLQFSIVDSLTKQSIPCYFKQELDSKVRESWMYRVCVVGKIRTRGDGVITSIEVEDIVRIGKVGFDWESTRVNITDGIESSEYIRGIRDDSYL